MFAYVARQIFFANGIQMAYDRALLWISMANPFLWMTAARCANAAAGISSGCVLARGEMSLASENRNVHDLRMHVSVLLGPGKFHNAWTV